MAQVNTIQSLPKSSRSIKSLHTFYSPRISDTNPQQIQNNPQNSQQNFENLSEQIMTKYAPLNQSNSVSQQVIQSISTQKGKVSSLKLTDKKAGDSEQLPQANPSGNSQYYIPSQFDTVQIPNSTNTLNLSQGNNNNNNPQVNALVYKRIKSNQKNGSQSARTTQQTTTMPGNSMINKYKISKDSNKTDNSSQERIYSLNLQNLKDLESYVNHKLQQQKNQTHSIQNSSRIVTQQQPEKMLKVLAQTTFSYEDMVSVNEIVQQQQRQQEQQHQLPSTTIKKQLKQKKEQQANRQKGGGGAKGNRNGSRTSPSQNMNMNFKRLQNHQLSAIQEDSHEATSLENTLKISQSKVESSKLTGHSEVVFNDSGMMQNQLLVGAGLNPTTTSHSNTIAHNNASIAKSLNSYRVFTHGINNEQKQKSSDEAHAIKQKEFQVQEQLYYTPRGSSGSTSSNVINFNKQQTVLPSLEAKKNFENFGSIKKKPQQQAVLQDKIINEIVQRESFNQILERDQNRSRSPGKKETLQLKKIASGQKGDCLSPDVRKTTPRAPYASKVIQPNSRAQIVRSSLNGPISSVTSQGNNQNINGLPNPISQSNGNTPQTKYPETARAQITQNFGDLLQNRGNGGAAVFLDFNTEGYQNGRKIDYQNERVVQTDPDDTEREAYKPGENDEYFRKLLSQPEDEVEDLNVNLDMPVMTKTQKNASVSKGLKLKLDTLYRQKKIKNQSSSNNNNSGGCNNNNSANNANNSSGSNGTIDIASKSATNFAAKGKSIQTQIAKELNKAMFSMKGLEKDQPHSFLKKGSGHWQKQSSQIIEGDDNDDVVIESPTRKPKDAKDKSIHSNSATKIRNQQQQQQLQKEYQQQLHRRIKTSMPQFKQPPNVSAAVKSLEYLQQQQQQQQEGPMSQMEKAEQVLHSLMGFNSRLPNGSPQVYIQALDTMETVSPKPTLMEQLSISNVPNSTTNASSSTSSSNKKVKIPSNIVHTRKRAQTSNAASGSTRKKKETHVIVKSNSKPQINSQSSINSDDSGGKQGKSSKSEAKESNNGSDSHTQDATIPSDSNISNNNITPKIPSYIESELLTKNDSESKEDGVSELIKQRRRKRANESDAILDVPRGFTPMEDEINNSSIIRDMENIVNTDINLSDEEVEYRDE